MYSHALFANTFSSLVVMYQSDLVSMLFFLNDLGQQSNGINIENKQDEVPRTNSSQKQKRVSVI